MRQLIHLAISLLFMLPGSAALAADKMAQISIIIDDLGNNLRHGQRAIALPGAVTYSILPFTPFGQQLAKQGHLQGKEIMLHLPMDNSHGYPLGPGALTFEQERPHFEQQLTDAIAATPYVSGINNHMGSDLTASSKHMQWLMQTLKHYPLYFVDSRTSAATVAKTTALATQIPSLDRDVFLDHETTPEFIDKQFKLLIKKAQKAGHAVAIGHPHPNTLTYLEKALPQLKALGVELVPPSQLLALENKPQLVVTRTATTATTSATERPATEAKLEAEAPTAVLAKRDLEIQSGQCRITEQLNITRVICG